jgi:CRP-like cAMP-binding protein
MRLSIINHNCPSAVELSPELKSFGKVDKYKKNQTIYSQGERSLGFYYVLSGTVGLVSLAPNGTESLHRVFGAHYFFGHRSFVTNDSYHATSLALNDVELIYFPFSDIEELQKDHPDLVLHFAKVLGRELRNAEERYNDLTGKRVIQRVVEALIFLKFRHPDHIWTRKEIGEFCGAKTETVTRVLTQIENEGFIKKDGREIKLLDVDGLIEYSDLIG